MLCCKQNCSLSRLMSIVALSFILLIIPLIECEVTEDTENSCQQRTSVQREEEVCELVPYTERYKDTCWNLFKWFSCTKTRIVYREECNTVLVTHIEIAWVCCSGYIENNQQQCIPVCLDGCVHGQCVNPDECQCRDGFRGDDCSSSCDNGYYGSGCESVCECENGAECDPVDGHCTCSSGYIGDKCDSVCSQWRHGMDCGLDCLCYINNTQSCSNVDGRCKCKSGYQGALCEIRCPANETGSGCGQKCPCQNNGVCLAEDAGCQCTAGYTGDVCADPCGEGEWGEDCVNKCHCFNNATCDPFTGYCLCLDGFIGDMCERECEIGFWGPGCSGDCSHCAFGMPCDFRDGTCLCNQFQSGVNCGNLSCPEGYFGIDCSHECLCENNATCDMITGQCTCLAVGFSGPTCADECSGLFYGVNCSQVCNCSEEYCDSVVGCVEIPATTSPAPPGEDEESSALPWIVLSAILLVAILAAIVGAVCVLCVRWRRNQKMRRPPPGYPPERNGFVNPIMAKKQEDKEDGIYIDQEYVKYSASNEKVSGIGGGGGEGGSSGQPSTSYEGGSHYEEYEPTYEGKKKKINREELPPVSNNDIGKKQPDAKKTQKPVVPPRPVKQTSQDHVYEDLDNLNGPEDQPSNPASSPNQFNIQEEDLSTVGVPQRRVSDNGVYQTPYGYYSPSQSGKNPLQEGQGKEENSPYDTPLYVEPSKGYVEPATRSSIGQMKPGASIKTYERVNPSNPAEYSGYADYADLMEDKEQKGEDATLVKIAEENF